MALGTDHFTGSGGDLDVMIPELLGDHKQLLIDLEAEMPTGGKLSAYA